ncbi:hypothetical protein BHE74_00000341 [Ensete ventricosum]|nr:hypothetical protein BHE74_00000341 [Ensete ventricosum]
MLTSGASGRVTALFSLRVLRGLVLLLRAAALLLLPFRWRPTFVLAAERSAPTPVDGRPESSSRKGGHSGVVVRVPAAMVPRRQREQEEAGRRALAMRLVVDTRKEGQRGRDFSMFTTIRGDTLFTQSWTPVNTETSLESANCRVGAVRVRTELCTYHSANLSARGPSAIGTILLLGSRSQDADPNISILREEREREREMGLCVSMPDRCMGGWRSLSGETWRRSRRATKLWASTWKVMERINKAQDGADPMSYSNSTF